MNWIKKVTDFIFVALVLTRSFWLIPAFLYGLFRFLKMIVNTNSPNNYDVFYFWLYSAIFASVEMIVWVYPIFDKNKD